MDSELPHLAQALRVRYGSRLNQIIFFGSRVRGGATKESDYDCLLIFNQVDLLLKQDLDRLAGEWLLDQGIIFSWIALSQTDLDRLRYEPFLQNARREGVAL